MSPIFFQHPSSLIFFHALPLAYFCTYPNKNPYWMSVVWSTRNIFEKCIYLSYKMFAARVIKVLCTVFTFTIEKLLAL